MASYVISPPESPPELTCESAGVPEGPDLGVREANQPHDESVQHVLVVEDAVLALEDDVVDEVHKVALNEKKNGTIKPFFPIH